MADNSTEKVVTTDAQHAREQDRRLDAQENPVTLRAGEWTISSEESSGNLVAHHSSGSGVKLADKPPEGANPDELTPPPTPNQVPAHKVPRMKVKGGAKSTGSGAITVYNVWNTTADYEYPAGAWALTASSFTIPEPGEYLFVLYMPWTGVVNGERSLEFRRNSTIIDIDTDWASSNRTMNLHITQTLICAQGDVIDVRVYQDSGSSVACGGANFGEAWAQMSIIKIGDTDYPEHAEDSSPYKGATTATTTATA